MSAFDGLKFDPAAQGQNGRVTQAIATASRRTGVDFKYLMDQARVESGMNPNARAPTSSATGLYQFIDQSWLAVLNEHGANYGMDWAANAIRKTSNGSYYVADPALRRQIMDLRNHPETASIMAAEFASDNRDYLEQRIGRRAESVDLYLAHFLGAGGAAKFLTSPQGASGASLFPAAARANSSIFYDRNGSARSLGEIRALFADKLNRDGGATYAANTSAPRGTWSMPDGTRMVLPADYMRIAQTQMGATEALDTVAMLSELENKDNAEAGAERGDGTLLADIHALTLGRAANAAPATANAQNARLAYLMLATLGR